jgi:D-2-hydroxyacid dehydrogenase (NADP+)
MAHTTLIYEPDTPSDALAYADGLARALPALPLIVTSDAAEAVSRAPEASVLVVKAQHASARLIAAMPRLEWIQALTTGIDPLLRLALPPGTVVTTMRGIHGPQMAELTLLLMMTLYRDFPRMLRNQRAARWERWGQRLLAGRTVVIVGVGTISEHLALLCKAFGLCTIGVTSRTHVEHFDELYAHNRLREAARRADFLVILAPYSAATHHLVDAAVLAQLQPDAYVINVARGNLLDEDALLDALRARRIAGAALDVFAEEPLPPDNPLWALDNVVITPHIGGMSDTYAEQVLPVLIHNQRAFASGDRAGMMNRVVLPTTS